MNKLVGEYNNIYHHFIDKKPIDTEFYALAKEIEPSHKAPKFKVGDRVRITKYRKFLSKGYTKNWSREIFVIDSVLKKCFLDI